MGRSVPSFNYLIPREHRIRAIQDLFNHASKGSGGDITSDEFQAEVTARKDADQTLEKEITATNTAVTDLADNVGDLQNTVSEKVDKSELNNYYTSAQVEEYVNQYLVQNLSDYFKDLGTFERSAEAEALLASWENVFGATAVFFTYKSTSPNAQTAFAFNTIKGNVAYQKLYLAGQWYERTVTANSDKTTTASAWSKCYYMTDEEKAKLANLTEATGLAIEDYNLLFYDRTITFFKDGVKKNSVTIDVASQNYTGLLSSTDYSTFLQASKQVSVLQSEKADKSDVYTKQETQTAITNSPAIQSLNEQVAQVWQKLNAIESILDSTIESLS